MYLMCHVFNNIAFSKIIKQLIKLRQHTHVMVMLLDNRVVHLVSIIMAIYLTNVVFVVVFS